MIKFALVPLLLVIACLLSGLYGAIHNQISYTVSPEYFTANKFHQFEVAFDGRVGAAIVGWEASWWMGIIIGAFLVPIGLVVPGNTNYFKAMLRVFLCVIATTLFTGLAGLGVAYLTVDAQSVGQISTYDNDIVDDVAFVRAWTMHRFSYLGGLVGILVGLVVIFIERRRVLNVATDEFDR